jgi:hypothetical protein
VRQRYFFPLNFEALVFFSVWGRSTFARLVRTYLRRRHAGYVCRRVSDSVTDPDRPRAPPKWTHGSVILGDPARVSAQNSGWLGVPRELRDKRVHARNFRLQRQEESPRTLVTLRAIQMVSAFRETRRVVPLLSGN